MALPFNSVRTGFPILDFNLGNDNNNAPNEEENTPPPFALRYGDVIEFFGASCTGKTECLLQIISTMILPECFGGNDVEVVFFDNDFKFSILRLLQIMEFQLKHFALDPKISNQIITDSMQRLLIYRCSDSFQFLITLQSLQGTIQKTPKIRAIMIDSISSFFWTQKIEDQVGIRQQKAISDTLKKLSALGVIVFATKSALFQEKDELHNQPSSSSTHTSRKEFMYHWGDIVKHKITLSIKSTSPQKTLLAHLMSPSNPTPTIHNTPFPLNNHPTIAPLPVPILNTYFSFNIDIRGVNSVTQLDQLHK